MATLEQMYTPQAFSPQTTLSQDIGASDTRIYVANVNVFPTPPTLATIGTDAASAETVKVTAKGTNYIDVQRGLLGTAKSWTTNSVIARNFSAADQTAIQKNINTLNALKLESVEADDVVDNTLTNNKLAKVATNTFKGRRSANQGNVEDLTVAQVLSMLNVSSGADKTTTILEALPPVSTFDANVRVVILDTLATAGAQSKYVTALQIIDAFNELYLSRDTSINGYVLKGGVNLDASDVGAAPASSDLTSGGTINGTLYAADVEIDNALVVGAGHAYLRLETSSDGDVLLSFSTQNDPMEWPGAGYAQLRVGTPEENYHATTKEYVDGAIAPLQMKNATSLPASGSALAANTLYNVSSAITTYNFVSPSSNGWAHGIFTAGTSSNITFSGTIIGKLPTFEANKKYEFDVLANTWIVQEIVSQS